MKPLETRKQDFIQEMNLYKKEDDTKEMLNSFYRYWTEINPNGKKMRFEKARTKGCFDTKRG